MIAYTSVTSQTPNLLHMESKIILAGLKKSGKSSILKVLFGKVSPHETMYLDPTQGIKQEPPLTNRLMSQCRLTEVSGAWPWEETPQEYDGNLFSNCQSLVLVVDASDEAQAGLIHALNLCRKVVGRAWRVKPSINVELFLHKSDRNYRFDTEAFGDAKLGFMREVSGQFAELLKPLGKNPDFVTHCTSIFDSSLYDAFSKVVQRSLLKDGRIEGLMDLLVSTSNLDKAFLFDLSSKVHFATDTTPSDPLLCGLMQDMLEVIGDFGSIYGQKGKLEAGAACTIGLNNGQNLYMRVLDATGLALVCLIREGHCDRMHLLNRNIKSFFSALEMTVK